MTADIHMNGGELQDEFAELLRIADQVDEFVAGGSHCDEYDTTPTDIWEASVRTDDIRRLAALSAQREAELDRLKQELEIVRATVPQEPVVPRRDWEFLRDQMCQAKRLLCELWRNFPETRERIDDATGPWFAWGSVRVEWEWRTDEQIAADDAAMLARKPRPEDSEVVTWQIKFGHEWSRLHAKLVDAHVAAGYEVRGLAPVSAASYPLPDDLYDSKDWRDGSYAERVEWLHTMFESKKRELEEFLSQPARTGEWLPMETAPRDGARILLADSHFSGEGSWIEAMDDGVDYMGNDAGFMDAHYRHFTCARSFGSDAYRHAGCQPTHWQPLPAPPTTKDSE